MPPPTAHLRYTASALARKEKERRQAGQEGEKEGPRSRLAEAAAEFNEAQQAFLLSSPSGLGVGAEAAISQAIKDGALDNLAGKGEPAVKCWARGAAHSRWCRPASPNALPATRVPCLPRRAVPPQASR